MDEKDIIWDDGTEEAPEFHTVEWQLGIWDKGQLYAIFRKNPSCACPDLFFGILRRDSYEAAALL